MSDELDFGSLSLDDVKLNGEQTPAATDANPPADTTPADTKGADATPPPADPANPVDPKLSNTESKDATPAPPADPSKDKTETASYKFKDDFIKEAVEYYEKTGDLTPYLQAKLVDFNSLSDEEIMRRGLREQYPDVSDKAFDKLYKQQVIDKFKLDAESFEEDDVELGKELLKGEASKLRAKYLDWQKGFKAPEPKADNSAEEMKAQLEQFANKIKEDSITKSILTDKRLAIKTADGEFNYELQNPNELLDMTLDNTKFFGQFTKPDGQTDLEKWYLTSAFAKDPQEFIKNIGNYFKGLGREEITKDLKNPSTNTVGDVPTEGSGDFTTGLLQAFATRGVSK
jgi:hypothetical protein